MTIGACAECGEPAKNRVEFHWAGLLIWLCGKHMPEFWHTPAKKPANKPKREIY